MNTDELVQRFTKHITHNTRVEYLGRTAKPDSFSYNAVFELRMAIDCIHNLVAYDQKDQSEVSDAMKIELGNMVIKSFLNKGNDEYIMNGTSRCILGEPNE